MISFSYDLSYVMLAIAKDSDKPLGFEEFRDRCETWIEKWSFIPFYRHSEMFKPYVWSLQDEGLLDFTDGWEVYYIGP